MFNILKKKNDINDNSTENLNALPQVNNNFIVKAFENNSIAILQEDIDNKQIYYFKASDIGKALGILNIRQSIQNYEDEDERVVRKVYDPYGTIQDTVFLTSQGVYRLLYNSKKPIAKKFRKWSGDILDDIIFNESVELKRQLENQKKLLKKKEIEYQEKLKQKELELNSYKEKKYEEIEKNGHVYIIKTDGGYKVGKTKDINNRMKGLQTANLKDIEVVLDFRTSNSDLLERTVHYVLDRYRCNSNREFFDCNVDHIKNVINIMGNTIDTLKSCYQNISNDELTNKLNEKLCTNYTIDDVELIRGNQSSNPPLYTSDPDFENWLNENIEINKNGILRLKDVCQKYLSEDIIQISTKQASLYKIQIENYLEKKYPFKNSIFYKYKDSSFHGIRYKGWLGFQLK